MNDKITLEFATESWPAKAETYVSWAAGKVVNKDEKRKLATTFACQPAAVYATRLQRTQGACWPHK